MGNIDWKSSYRVVVFVPESALEKFIQRISPEIPSFLGPYDHVVWWSGTGTEQFRPLQGADQAAGKTGEIDREPSRRVELSFPFDKAALKKFVEDVIVPAHPWEKPVVYICETAILAP
jgi:hypothetical protein